MYDLNSTLFISDLDGTLLDRSAALSARTIDVIRRAIASGVQFTLATARAASSAPGFAETLGITLPLVLMNGVVTYDLETGKYIAAQGISAAAASSIRNVALNLGVDALEYAYSGGRVTCKRYRAESGNAITSRIAARDMSKDGDFDENGETIYFTFAGSYGDMRELRDGVANVPGIAIEMVKDDYSESGWFVECFNTDANKGNGVRFLRERLGFTRVVGFGDNLNDTPLFEACDEAYAVANAKPEVKVAATGIIGANVDDGVAAWIEENVMR